MAFMIPVAAAAAAAAGTAGAATAAAAGIAATASTAMGAAAAGSTILGLSASTIGLGLTAASTLATAGSTIIGGMAANKAARFEASQLEDRAQSERAMASRQANEEGRQRRLMLSRAQAVGAASGGGRDAVLEGEIEREGRFRSLTALYDGEEAARGLGMQAASRRAEGRAARLAGFIKGGTTLVGGGASMYSKYA